ncbi:trichome birefringence-like protein 19, partial [Tanacetum coccineum]
GSGGGGNKCDLFSGEWVENPDGPYYTNETCWAIQEHQNCMKFGRKDRDFLKWRWKPYKCELPIFDPILFLKMMRGKSLAFVGDSVARNHMQSLLCLLSRVAYPNDVTNSSDQNFKRYEFPEYSFNISIFWSPYLVNTERTNQQDITQPFKLYLDEFDKSWTSHIEKFNYVIISSGQWFFRPTMFYSNRRVIGCLYCTESNIRHRSSSFSYRRAWWTAFRALSLKNFKGTIFLRSFVPSHFEGGHWDKGGDCIRTKPFKSNESVMADYDLEMYNTQPDGHPSKYGHWPQQNVTMANDCVHWCLPGPIDAWNDFLMELINREDASPTFRGSNTRSGGLWSGGLDSKRVPTVTNIAVTNELGVVASGVVAWTQRGVPTVTNEDVGSSRVGYCYDPTSAKFRKIDPDKWEFANEEFQKDKNHLLKNIHRRKPVHSHSTPQTSTVDPKREAFEEEIDKIKRKKTSLEKNLIRYKHQQPSSKLQLEDLTQRVNSMEQRQDTLLTFLKKAAHNPEFVEHLAQKLESIDFSTDNKKRRFPKSRAFPDDGVVDDHSPQSPSRPDFGSVSHHEFSGKLRLELSPAVSDINFLSNSTQSSNEDGGSPQFRSHLHKI